MLRGIRAEEREEEELLAWGEVLWLIFYKEIILFCINFFFVENGLIKSRKS